MFFLIVNILFLLLSESLSHDLPTYFPKCALDDSDLNNCIARAANALRPYIKKGIKEIKFPSLDPLVISHFDLIQDSNVVNYTGSAWNFTIRGLDNFDLTEITYNPNTMTFNGKIEYDSLLFSSSYTMKGKLVSIPIQGKGIGRVNFGSISGTFEIIGKIVKRKGIEYYKPTNTKVRMVIGDGSYYFSGLFDGNENLERITNEMVNRNAKVITDAITPVLERLAEKGLMSIMKSLTQTVSYKQLFPPSHK